MNTKLKLGLWLAALIVGLVVVAATAAIAIATGLPDADYRHLLRIVATHAPVLGMLAVVVLLACTCALCWLFKNYVAALRSLDEQTRLVIAANPEHRIRVQGGAEVVDLASTISRLADAHRQTKIDLEKGATAATARLEEERNRLAALMSELSEGVLLCNAEGRILLYNEKALALFDASGAHEGAARPGLVGLGRSVFSLLDRDQVAHALEKLKFGLEHGAAYPTTRFITHAVTGALIKVTVAPFQSAGTSVGGMVLTLEDVTDLMEQETERRTLLRTFAAGIRAPVANLCAAAEMLVAAGNPGEGRRSQPAEIVAAESRNLSAMINDWMSKYADALKAGLALEDMRVTDLMTVARRRIEGLYGMHCTAEPGGDGDWIRVDSFALVEALAFLAGHLREDYGVKSISLRASATGKFAELDMAWRGAIVGSDAISLWETQPMQIGSQQTPLTLKDVLERHAGEVWIQSHKPSQQSWFRLQLPRGAPAEAAPRTGRPAKGRPEYYDFDLFRNDDSTRALNEKSLVDLHYTAFDTETTGLEPSAGDEIISIGAVRIVNARLLKGEVYEQLVDPQRPVSKESVRIHGIGAQALEGQPRLGQVLPQFHRFCEDTVLVAHNAAFDMRFLELKEQATGVRFAQPVLDTLLLSVIVHPNQEGHSLEAVAERLGLNVIGRHTALGDALLTGEIFLKLLPLLAEQGILTLGQALTASRQTYYARLQY